VPPSPSSKPARRARRRGPSGLELLRPPPRYFRVTTWSQPFEPPPPAPPLGSASDLGGRFDSPDATWRTLYTAASREAAYGEKLAFFAHRPELEEAIAAFLVSNPDSPEDAPRAELGSADVADWKIGVAEADQTVWLLDATHPRTHAYWWPRLKPILSPLGYRRLDSGTVLTHDRRVTRTLAAAFYDFGTKSRSKRDRIAGIRFASSVWPAWECFALWEPIPIGRHSADDVDLADPAFVSAAAKLGVLLN
jgi:hypothetical protein